MENVGEDKSKTKKRFMGWNDKVKDLCISTQAHNC